MTELVHYEVADEVATITLDSPHNRNALSRQLVTGLFDGLDRGRGGRRRQGRPAAVGRPGVLLRRRPVGGDRRGHGRGRAADRRAAAADRRLAQAGRRPAATAPVRAGGIGIVAAADIAVAAPAATFALTEVRLGLAAAVISLTVLPPDDQPRRRRAPS